MPTSRPSRSTPMGTSRRLGALAASLALVVVFAGACVGQKDPTGYGDSVRENFVAGCLEGYVPAGGGKDPEAASHKTLCGCIYDEMSDKTTGVPFDEFKSAQSAIRKDPKNPANRMEKLMPKFPNFVKTCTAKVQAGPVGS